MDRAKFYSSIRGSLFGGSLSAEQVGGMETMLNAGQTYPVKDLRHMAYIFATVFHEVGRRMVPVREGFAKTDAGAIAAVEKLFKAHKISTNYAAPVDGVSYFGRGRVQNTWHDNYVKLEERFGLPFVSQPGLLLDPDIDATVTIAGHMEGIWTGKKLIDYINDRGTDYINARKIINGTDKATVIAGYATKFEKAFRDAVWDIRAVTPVVIPEPAPAPVPATCAPSYAPTAILQSPVAQAIALEAVAQAVAPAVPSEHQSSSPVAKVIGAGKGAAAGGGISVAITALLIGVMQGYNVTIPGVDGTTLGLIVGTVVTSVSTGIASMIGTYKAKRNAD